MAEDRVDIPTSFWERLVSDKRRLAVFIGGALVLAAVFGALVVWGAVRLGNENDTTSIAGLDPIDGESSTASGSETSSTTEGAGMATDAEGEDAENGDGDDSSAGEDGDGSKPVRAAVIAYRIDDVVWIASEDGSGAREIARCAEGNYTLSPDGTVLAWIDSAEHTLHLTDVASRIDRVVGPAEDIKPSWAPDSTYVAYTSLSATRLEVRRVSRDAQGDTALGSGHAPAVSGDGASIAYIGGGAPGSAAAVVVRELDGSSRTLDKTLATEVVFGGDGIVYAVAANTPGSERIMTAALDGGKPRELVGEADLDGPVMYADLAVSGSGRYLAYAAAGDDGFSRTYIVTLTGGTHTALTVRRDTYPMQWGADDSVFFFVEGNAFQGEVTRLMRAGVDGLGRGMVVEGAGL